MSRHSITPDPVKFELHAYGEVYDMSNCIDNWQMLEFTLKRDATSGIFHQISFPFEFVFDGYDVVKSIYEKYKYRAKADMYVYVRKDNWPYEQQQYHDAQIFNLDWTAYEKTDTKIEIDSKRTSLYDYIKAKHKIVYDIPVSEIKEDKPWRFKRIELENILTEFATVEAEVKVVSTTGKNGYQPGITYKGSEISVPNKINEQTLGEADGMPNVNWFVQSDKLLSEAMPLKIQGKLNIPYLKMEDAHNQVQRTRIGFWRRTPTGYLDDNAFLGGIEIFGSNFEGSYSHNFDIEIELGAFNEELEVGDRLYFFIEVVKGSSTEGQNAYLHFGEGFEFEFKVSYNSKFNAENIDIINPKTLLQDLVDKMTDSKGVYTSDIEDFNEDTSDMIMMAASESIRGIVAKETNNGAEVHTSYLNFSDWMNTYGYEQHIEGNALVFKRRGKGFRSDLIAMELSEKECGDLREYVNTKYLYSGVKIGYERKDIEDINARYEFNGVHDYSTDLNAIDNILELISPYRADCYGIEFLTQERGKDTTDDKSDKDMFLVNVSKGVSSYLTVKNVYSGNILNDTIFNGALNPFNLMVRNQNLIGVSVDNLRFSASDSNSAIIIDYQPINANYQLPKGDKIFEATMYDIASKNIQRMPTGENVNGLVRFSYRGEIYEGYIDEISKNPAWEIETIWILQEISKDKTEVLLTQTQLSFNVVGGIANVVVYIGSDNKDFVIENAASWMIVEKYKNVARIRALLNTTTNARQQDVIIRSVEDNDSYAVIRVTQKGF